MTAGLNIAFNPPQFGADYDPMAMRVFVEEVERLHAVLTAMVDDEATPVGVDSFNGRTGVVVPLQADYDSFFLTPAEGDSLFLTPAEGDAAYLRLDTSNDPVTGALAIDNNLTVRDTGGTNGLTMGHNGATLFSQTYFNTSSVEHFGSPIHRFNAQDNVNTFISIGEPGTARGTSQAGQIRLYGEGAASVLHGWSLLVGSGSDFALSAPIGAGDLPGGMKMIHDLEVFGFDLIVGDGTTDSVTMSHNGTDFSYVYAGTASVIYSGATFHDFLDSIRMRGGNAISFFDSTNIDVGTFSHDGNNFNSAFGAAGATLDWDITGLTGSFIVNRAALGASIIRIGESTTLRGDAADAHLDLYAEQGADINRFRLTNTGTNVQFVLDPGGQVQWTGDGAWDFQIRDGVTVRVYDSTDADTLEFSHNGTDAIITTAGVSPGNVIIEPRLVAQGSGTAANHGGTITLDDANPSFNVQESDAILDEKNTLLFWTGGNFEWRLYNDAWSGFNTLFEILRSGITGTFNVSAPLRITSNDLTLTGAASHFINLGDGDSGDNNWLVFGKGFNAESGIEWDRAGTTDVRISVDATETLIIDSDVSAGGIGNGVHFQDQSVTFMEIDGSINTKLLIHDGSIQLDSRGFSGGAQFQQKMENAAAAQTVWQLYDHLNVKQWDLLMPVNDSMQWRDSAGNIALQLIQGGDVRIRDGKEFRIYESIDVAYGGFRHDATDFIFDFPGSNTTDLNITGLTGAVNVDGNYLLEGYTTGKSVARSTRLNFQPGATPGTNINVSTNDGGGRSYNSPSITNATNLAKSGTSGSFSLNAAGTILTLNLTEDVIGCLGISIVIHDINSSSTTEMYFPDFTVVGSNIDLRLRQRGGTAVVDLTTILDAGDRFDIMMSYITSS
jgi:hypothetical protein